MKNAMMWIGGALIFGAEVAMYVGFLVWGNHAFDGLTGWLVGIAAVVTVAAFWMRFLSPKAPQPLQPRIVHLTVREALLILGAAAWFLSGYTVMAIVTLAAAVVGTAISIVWPFVHAEPMAPR